MNFSNLYLLLDVPAVSSVEIVGVAVGFILLIACVVGAFLVFTMMKRTLKMAFRLAIVGVLLVIGLVGGVSLWWFSQGSSQPAKRPANVRPNR